MQSKIRKLASARASQFQESVIREMSRLAAQHKAVNLAQGLPDFPCPAEFKDAASRALFDDVNQYAITWGDKLLRQAIENVVRNGAYYTPDGTRVEVELHSERFEGRDMAMIRVRDHGPGVPEEKIAQLTEPFFRVAEARERNSGGTGLGLAIAQQVVLQHGGSLRFQNTPGGEGLIVDISLPLERQAGKAATTFS